MAHRNAPIHPVLRLIYAFLRFVSWLGSSVFYRRRQIIGREHLRFDGPAIVVSNHPNTLMDPLNVGIPIRQEMFFLANYGLFKNPVSGWILSRLFCIPVKRKEDVAEGESRDNDAAFEASFRHLEKHGVLYIAAEGVSWMNRYVRPFKTGAARIAFGAERRNQWQLGVKIIPVGLSYESPRHFRSRMTVEYGPPIDPGPWAEAEQADHEQAVEAFTKHLEQQVRERTLDSGKEENDEFVAQMETICATEWGRGKKQARETYLFLKQFLAKSLDKERFIRDVAHYFSELGKARLHDFGVQSVRSGRRGWPDFLIVLLLFPAFLLGLSAWFLPAFLPWLLCKRLKLYPGYDSNVKVLAGLFTFPLALWAGGAVLSAQGISAWAILPIFFLLGLATEWFSDAARRFGQTQKARVFSRKHPEIWQKIVAQREAIVTEMVA